jgi:flagellar hook-associated protein FlgK
MILLHVFIYPIFPSSRRKFEKQTDDYKKEVDAKTAEINQLKQNIFEMKKRISEIENQQKFTKHPEKTDDALNILRDDSLNLQKK